MHLVHQRGSRVLGCWCSTAAGCSESWGAAGAFHWAVWSSTEEPGVQTHTRPAMRDCKHMKHHGHRCAWFHTLTHIHTQITQLHTTGAAYESPKKNFCDPSLCDRRVIHSNASRQSYKAETQKHRLRLNFQKQSIITAGSICTKDMHICLRS